MVFKISKMIREEYDSLLEKNHILKISFFKITISLQVPFPYVFNEDNMYFLIDLIRSKNLSDIVLKILAQNPEKPVEKLITDKNTYVWKLNDVEDIVALKNSDE